MLLSRPLEHCAVGFRRDWGAYRDGFGSENEWWLGLERAHGLTSQYQCGFKVSVQCQKDKKWGHVTYRSIVIDNETSSYARSLSKENTKQIDKPGTKFVTHDRNDDRNCAKNNLGGWWFETGATCVMGALVTAPCANQQADSCDAGPCNEWSGCDATAGDNNEVSASRLLLVCDY